NIDKAMAVCKAAPRAIEDLSFALSQSALAPDLLAIRATALARRGQPAEAAVAVDKLRSLNTQNPEHLYQAARCYALCLSAALQHPDAPTAQEKAARERYARRAIDSLREALRHGYKDIGQVKLTKDFDCVRGREDFKALLAGAEAVPKPGSQPSTG